MKEQRRHQRIRFNVQPLVRMGQAGMTGLGRLENLSLGGLMVRTDLSLKSGEIFGCEFSLFGLYLIDIPATVVGSVGELFSARFQAGPISETLLQDEMIRALSSGRGSVLSVNELQGRRVMRIQGGLNESLRNDFLHGLKTGVDEIDLSRVTDIDLVGAELCQTAMKRQIGIIRPVGRVSDEIAAAVGWRNGG
ncbi:MAG: PilZ domain-containing protein [Candidatus Accumulibacter sp.]|jgi:hypothetical protein|nr:PilZ domain-containing protein [Accumulibacter sp.]